MGHYYLSEKYFYNEFHKNYRNCFISYATHVHDNRDRFPLSLVDQAEQGISYKDVQFVKKKNTVAYFEEIIFTTLWKYLFR